MSFDKSHRNLSGRTPLMAAAAPVLRMGQAEYQAEVTGVLQAVFGPQRNPVKALAAVANTNIRTAENWLAGRCAPSGLPLLRLMAQVPELQATIRRLTAMESDLDPRFEQAMHQAIAVFQQVRRPREQFCIARPRLAAVG